MLQEKAFENWKAEKAMLKKAGTNSAIIEVWA